VKYLLDSDTAINIMRHPRRAAAMRFRSTSPSDMAISIVTKAELLVGPNSKKAYANELEKVTAILDRVATLPFDDPCAHVFGRIAAALFDGGSPVDGMDVQIAATAIHRGLIVVTRNVHDFGKIPDIQSENWVTDFP
jgi:tRNA(fMet)-specific endonuclease VapC